MTETLTYGLVSLMNRQGNETTNVLKQVTGTWIPAYECTLCSVAVHPDDAWKVYTFICPDCGNRDESSYEDEMECNSCLNYEDDEDGTPVQLERTDGVDGTIEHRGCGSCIGGPLQETDSNALFQCEECDDVINPEDDSVYEHLYEHLNGAWT